MKERDLSLDFFRGIAAISVIFIHTVFWSGGSYVPEIFRTVALLVDVPFFIFLSGWSMNYSSKLPRIFTNLLKIWFHWILFISLIDLFCFFAFKNHITKSVWVKQIFFAVGNSIPNFPVINGSLWFMPMYVMVSICGGVFINFWNLINIDRRKCFYIVAFLLIGLTYISIGLGNTWFFLSRTVCFYLSAFIIGWYAPQIKIKNFIQYVVILLGIIILWFLISRFFCIPAKNLQSAKFPCHIMYFAASLLSFFTSIFFRDRMNFCEKNKVLECIQGGVIHIGRNAICFYFAQGVGSSVIFHFTKYSQVYGWKFTLLVCFGLNVIITILIAVFLILIFRFADIGIKKISGLYHECF